MTDAVFDFRSIRRKLERQEQKAEFEAKNPPEPSMYGWPYGVAVPYGRYVGEHNCVPVFEVSDLSMTTDWGPELIKSYQKLERERAGSQNAQAAVAPLKSMAHPEWPYAGTPHEWRKFKI